MASSKLETSHWESGKQYLGTLLQLPEAMVRYNSGGKVCEVRQICYCGVFRCEGSASKTQSVGQLRVDGASEAAVTSRLLQAVPTTTQEPYIPSVRPEMRADVLIVFGIEVTGKNQLLGVSKTKMYSFRSSFHLEDPWAQRRSLDLCSNFPRELKVTEYVCWLEGFKKWWTTEQGNEWPVRPNMDFHGRVKWYAENRQTNSFETTNYIWFADDGKVKATYSQAYIDVSKRAGGAAGMAAMALWDKHLAAFNAGAEAAIKGAWHASKLWQNSEAEVVIVNSTLATLAISLGCVLLGVLIFTRSLHLAIIVMLLVLFIIVGLAFFMVKIMNWAVGAIEVLSLIVFVGFAVDYILHLCHKYHSCHITDVEEEELDEEDEEPPPSFVGRAGRVSMAIVGGAPVHAGRKSLGPGHRQTRLSVKISDVGANRTTRKGVEKHAKNHKVLAKNRSTERFERAKYALERMGGSVVGSALTTVGSAIFLLPCTVHIFFKLGAVVCGVTIYAVIFALLPLPAVLMVFGPCGHDFKSVLDLLGRVGDRLAFDDDEFEEDDEDVPPVDLHTEGDKDAEESEKAHRRYVLNMPRKGMGQCDAVASGESSTPGATASRTKITLSG
eukprot:TRINITY_DN1689_c3_g1_i1.p1 TRINITY_DN1689_c3_g1~~TRINITY_DN1689_c3_g1_i1.p1  ORF type:complete len:640 (-),score=89.71 TRINITY_DN1689_c3_g1_i1:80-1909(-)